MPYKFSIISPLLQKYQYIKLLLLQCGDIEQNPGPMPNLLAQHPPSYKHRCKVYFIPCTIKLQPEYQHLAKKFAPLLTPAHPNHADTNRDYPYLSKFLLQNPHHLPPRILYALITTISPSPHTCDSRFIETADPHWTTVLLNKMALLPNPPEHHITIP